MDLNAKIAARRKELTGEIDLKEIVEIDVLPQIDENVSNDYVSSNTESLSIEEKVEKRRAEKEKIRKLTKMLDSQFNKLHFESGDDCAEKIDGLEKYAYSIGFEGFENVREDYLLRATAKERGLRTINGIRYSSLEEANEKRDAFVQMLSKVFSGFLVLFLPFVFGPLVLLPKYGKVERVVVGVYCSGWVLAFFTTGPGEFGFAVIGFVLFGLLGLFGYAIRRITDDLLMVLARIIALIVEKVRQILP